MQLLKESTKLEFGNREQIRVLKKMQEDYYSYWTIIVKDSWGYETVLYMPYVCKYEEEAIQYAKDWASRWCTLYETFEYACYQDPQTDGHIYTPEDFEDYNRYEDYCRSKGLDPEGIEEYL